MRKCSKKLKKIGHRFSYPRPNKLNNYDEYVIDQVYDEEYDNEDYNKLFERYLGLKQDDLIKRSEKLGINHENEIFIEKKNIESIKSKLKQINRQNANIQHELKMFEESISYLEKCISENEHSYDIITNEEYAELLPIVPGNINNDIDKFDFDKYGVKNYITVPKKCIEGISIRNIITARQLYAGNLLMIKRIIQLYNKFTGKNISTEVELTKFM